MTSQSKKGNRLSDYELSDYELSDCESGQWSDQWEAREQYRWDSGYYDYRDEPPSERDEPPSYYYDECHLKSLGKSRKVCWRFKKKGKCRFGETCFFVHVQKIPRFCRDFLNGRCRFNEKCRFVHKRQRLCKAFRDGKRCRFGSRCYFAHTFQPVCRHHLRNRCWFGKKCRKYHFAIH